MSAHNTQISNPKISLTNFIGTSTNYPIKNMLVIADSVANINLENQSNTKIETVIFLNDMTA